jgi:hypothetical protein
MHVIVTGNCESLIASMLLALLKQLCFYFKFEEAWHKLNFMLYMGQ